MAGFTAFLARVRAVEVLVVFKALYYVVPYVSYHFRIPCIKPNWQKAGNMPQITSIADADHVY